MQGTTFGAMVLAAIALAACATARPGPPLPPVSRFDGDHLRIISAYLRTGSDLAVVRGMVAADPLWRGPIAGGLRVSAFDASGTRLAVRTVRWSQMPNARRPRTATYTAALDVPSERVARIVVEYVSSTSREAYPRPARLPARP